MSSPATGRAGTLGCILVVDDEPMLLKLYTGILSKAGFRVAEAVDGREAILIVAQGGIDAILSDISMPGMTGLELLRAIRERDLELPVILLTANPALESAIQAIEYGALRYLIKPVTASVLVSVATQAVRLSRLARVKREALIELGRPRIRASDLAGLEVIYERALRRLWVAYQPIVSWSERTVYGYEALIRTDEPGVQTMGALAALAERLGVRDSLDQRVIKHTFREVSTVQDVTCLFVNIHPHTLTEAALYEGPLAAVAGRVVLEVTEAAPLTQVPDLAQCLHALRTLGYRLAIDDLGAGYAGLANFALLEPEVVKLDMDLIRGIDQAPTKQKLVRSMIQLCHDMKVQVICEGVETIAERDTVLALGGDLFQGYLFARPDRPFPAIHWGSE